MTLVLRVLTIPALCALISCKNTENRPDPRRPLVEHMEVRPDATPTPMPKALIQKPLDPAGEAPRG